MNNQVIAVKIGLLGKKITEYILPTGISVQECYKLAERNNKDIVPVKEFYFNGEWVSPDYILNKNGILLYYPFNFESQPQTRRVYVGEVGSEAIKADITKDTTVQELLSEYFRLPYENENIWFHKDNQVKGYQVNLSEQNLPEGCYIILEKKESKKSTVLKIIEKIIDDMYYHQHKIPEYYAAQIIELFK
jgi:hypothetical protein